MNAATHGNHDKKLSNKSGNYQAISDPPGSQHLTKYINNHNLKKCFRYPEIYETFF